ncbi:hypothetical protein RA269_28550, partial [Pseudomonas syringae pv. tagetis]|uniref:hypothetical protein n=1 Tax=Pseudomonas syringae group genomosp. 7 TaxID=251699 RepID=UPI00376FA8D2
RHMPCLPSPVKAANAAAAASTLAGAKEGTGPLSIAALAAATPSTLACPSMVEPNPFYVST